MAILWKPDHCDCEIWENYSPNPLDPDNSLCTRTYKKKCAAHSTSSDANEVLLENQSKNFAEAELKDKMDSHAGWVMDSEGNFTRQWKDGVKFKYDFDANRNLRVEIVEKQPDFQARVAIDVKADPVEVQTILDSRFGKDKVKAN